MKQHRINIMKLGDRLLPINITSQKQETLSPFTHHTKRIASTKSANTKRGWCRMLPTSECDFDNLKIELSSANLDLIIEKTKLLR